MTLLHITLPPLFFFFFLNDPPTPEIYTLPLHDALPISIKECRGGQHRQQIDTFGHTVGATSATCAIRAGRLLHRAALDGEGFRLLQRLPGSGNSRHRSEEHTSELQSQSNLVCRLLLEKK